jgi:hypothetical protein
LGELRDGKSVAGIDDAGRRQGSTPQNAGMTDPSYSKARVQETATNLDTREIWRQVLEKIPAKPFLRMLSDLVRPIGIEGRNFLLAHSPDEKSKIETLASANNRRQLEMLLKEASGRDWSVKFVAKDGIAPRGAVNANSGQSFKDDPLIQEAIELFKAQVKS